MTNQQSSYVGRQHDMECGHEVQGSPDVLHATFETLNIRPSFLFLDSTRSDPILSYAMLSYAMLSYAMISYPILSYLVPSCLDPFYSLLFYHTPSYSFLVFRFLSSSDHHRIMCRIPSKTVSTQHVQHTELYRYI